MKTEYRAKIGRATGAAERGKSHETRGGGLTAGNSKKEGTAGQVASRARSSSISGGALNEIHPGSFFTEPQQLAAAAKKTFVMADRAGMSPTQDAAVTASGTAAAVSHGGACVDPIPPNISGGGGEKKTAVAYTGVTRTSGALLPRQVALPPSRYPAPPTTTAAMTSTHQGLLLLPQQQQQQTKQHGLSARDEETGGARLLSSSAGAAGRRSDDPRTAMVANFQNNIINQQQQALTAAPSAGDDLLSVATPPGGYSCRRLRGVCGRALVASLNFVWSTATVTVTLVAALLAILITFWALSPVCTTCVRSSRRVRSSSNTGAAATADESGWSTLYINQLQVSQG